MVTETEIVAQAGKDYFSKSGRYENPYGIGSLEFNAYERGWMQALKRDDAKLVALNAPIKPVVAAPRSEVNLYAELKGRSGPRK